MYTKVYIHRKGPEMIFIEKKNPKKWNNRQWNNLVPEYLSYWTEIMSWNKKQHISFKGNKSLKIHFKKKIEDLQGNHLKALIYNLDGGLYK